MLRINDTLGGDPVQFNYVMTKTDVAEAVRFAKANKVLAMDTESTGLNCYHPEWQLRTFQFGHGDTSYVIPAWRIRTISKIFTDCDVFWIGHNGPHDVRSIDAHLGFETGVVCMGETYIAGHQRDPRKREDEGGVGHGLKEMSTAFVGRDAGKWEKRLKEEFKRIEIPIPGEVYKSGPRKGQQKMRKAKLSEGWGLIDPTNKHYIAYAAADPVLTYRLWQFLTPTFRSNKELYRFDLNVQQACDQLQRRGMRLDVSYTESYKDRLDRASKRYAKLAADMGCENIYSGQQVADALIELGARLKEKTDGGKWKTDDKVMKSLLEKGNDDVKRLVRLILRAKRVTKRRDAYADAMLRERDAWDRIHPSINSLAARTARMSISGPALQQLPTKDGDEE